MKILGWLQSWSKKENNKLALQNQKNTALNAHLLFPVRTASGHEAASSKRLEALSLITTTPVSALWQLVCFNFSYKKEIPLNFLKNCGGYTDTGELGFLFQIFHLPRRAQRDDAAPGHYTRPISLEVKNQLQGLEQQQMKE